MLLCIVEQSAGEQDGLLPLGEAAHDGVSLARGRVREGECTRRHTGADVVDAQVCADTTYIVVGTYFKPFTDAYGQSCSPAKISFGGRNDVTRPSMFYYLILRTKSGSTRKSVRDCRADELKCAAFVLRHNMEKGHKPQAKDMMKVSDLEELTGFQFFANVPNAPKSSYNPSDWGL